MPQVKFKFFSILISSLFILFLSCSKDTTCTPKAFNENIIGTWNLSYTVLGYTQTGSGTFNADGSFSTTPDDFLVAGQPTDKKTYIITGNNITFKSTGGGLSVLLDGTLSSNACNKIVIAIPNFGTSLTMTH